MNPPPPEPTDPLWQGGWYRFAHRVDSPNFGPRPPGACIDLVVVHSISLPPGVYGGDEVGQLFTNTLDWDAHPYFQGIRGMQVSAHFFIRRDGALWQFVSCDERAWHAGASQWRGRANCNDDSIGIELEGLEGGPFEPAQYEALAKFGILDAACMHLVMHPERLDVGAGTHPEREPVQRRDPRREGDGNGG